MASLRQCKQLVTEPMLEKIIVFFSLMMYLCISKSRTIVFCVHMTVAFQLVSNASKHRCVYCTCLGGTPGLNWALQPSHWTAILFTDIHTASDFLFHPSGLCFEHSFTEPPGLTWFEVVSGDYRGLFPCRAHPFFFSHWLQRSCSGCKFLSVTTLSNTSVLPLS